MKKAREEAPRTTKAMAVIYMATNIYKQRQIVAGTIFTKFFVFCYGRAIGSTLHTQ